jgi:hypothetical protein
MEHPLRFSALTCDQRCGRDGEEMVEIQGASQRFRYDEALRTLIKTKTD